MYIYLVQSASIAVKNFYTQYNNSVKFMSTPADDLEVQIGAARLACLKAFAQMQTNKMGMNCLCANAVAARILAHYHVPFSAVAGYTHLETPETGEALLPHSMPHVWLVSGEEGLVTDLTFSGPARKTMILGKGFGFHEDAVRPGFSATAKYPVYTGSADKPVLPFEVLSAQAMDLEGYLNRSPAHVKTTLKPLIEKALDGAPKIELDPSAFTAVAQPGDAGTTVRQGQAPNAGPA